MGLPRRRGSITKGRARMVRKMRQEVRRAVPAGMDRKRSSFSPLEGTRKRSTVTEGQAPEGV